MPKRTGEKYFAIIEAAIRVIAENGYHNSQVAKIAREANVADGTVYLYFENKEDILIYLFKEKMGQLIVIIEKDLSSYIDAKEKLRRLVELHLSFLQADRNLALVTQIQLRQVDQVIKEGISEPLKRYFNLIDKMICQGKEQGVFSADLDIPIARAMIFGTLDEITTRWVMSKRKYKVTESAEQIYRMLINGLVGKK